MAVLTLSAPRGKVKFVATSQNPFDQSCYWTEDVVFIPLVYLKWSFCLRTSMFGMKFSAFPNHVDLFQHLSQALLLLQSNWIITTLFVKIILLLLTQDCILSLLEGKVN